MTNHQEREGRGFMIAVALLLLLAVFAFMALGWAHIILHWR